MGKLIKKELCYKHYFWIYFYIKKYLDQNNILNNNINNYSFINFNLFDFLEDLKKNYEENYNINFLFELIKVENPIKKIFQFLKYLNEQNNNHLINLVVYIIINKNSIYKKIIKRDKKKNLVKIKEFLAFFKKNYLTDLIISFENETLDEFFYKNLQNILDINIFYKEFINSSTGNKINILEKNLIYLKLKFPEIEYGTILHYATFKNDLELVKYIILKNNKLINKDDKQKMIPLFIAVKNKNLDIVKFLLDAGSNINHLEKNKNTIVYYAVYYGNLDIIKLLISYKGDYNKPNQLNRTPLIKSIFLNQREIFKYLITLNNINIEYSDDLLRSAIHMCCWGSEGGKKGKKTINDINEDYLEAFKIICNNKNVNFFKIN